MEQNKNMENKLVLHQDIYQPKHHFDVQILFCNKIIEIFPNLSSTSVQVIAKAIMNKLVDGVEYPKEIENVVQQIYPVIVDSLKDENK